MKIANQRVLVRNDDRLYDIGKTGGELLSSKIKQFFRCHSQDFTQAENYVH